MIGLKAQLHSHQGCLRGYRCVIGHYFILVSPFFLSVVLSHNEFQEILDFKKNFSPFSALLGKILVS